MLEHTKFGCKVTTFCRNKQVFCLLIRYFVDRISKKEYYKATSKTSLKVKFQRILFDRLSLTRFNSSFDGSHSPSAGNRYQRTVHTSSSWGFRVV